MTLLIAGRAIQGAAAAILTRRRASPCWAATFDENETQQGNWPVGRLWRADGGRRPGARRWLVDNVSWRAVFLLNVPLAIAAVGLAIAFACERP